MKRLATRLIGSLGNPLGMFILLAVAAGRGPFPALRAETILLLSFPLAHLVAEGTMGGGAGAGRLTPGRIVSSALYRLLDSHAIVQLLLLLLLFKSVIPLKRGGPVAILVLLLVRAVRAALVTTQVRPPPIRPHPEATPHLTRISDFTRRILYHLSGNVLVLLVFLALLFGSVLGEDLGGYTLLMLAWTIRRNRHFLVDESPTRRALTEALDLESNFDALKRWSLVYVVLGSLVLPVALLVGFSHNFHGGPQLWRTISFLAISVPVAVCIRRSPRFAGTFLVGWTLCGMYVALTRAIVDTALAASWTYWVSEFALPACMLWYLFTRVDDSGPADRVPDTARAGEPSPA